MARNTTDLPLRVLSLLALLLLAAVIATGVLLIIRNPGLFLLYLVCAVVLVTGGWLMLSSPGRSLWGIALSVLAVVAIGVVTFVFFTQAGNGVLLAVCVGLGLLYALIAGTVSRRYWAARRRRSTVPVRQWRRPVLIVNPKSGDGRAEKVHLADRAREHGIEVVEMRPGQDMSALAREAADTGADVIGVSGGDGSIGAVADVAIERDLPLVVLPGGTRCHFARDIGLDPEYLVEALAAFQGIERRVDIGRFGDRRFLNNVSLGLYADIISRPEYRENKLEVTLKVARDLLAAEQPYYDLRFTDDDGNRFDHAAQVLVGVNRYETVGLSDFGERKHLDRGELQVVVVPEVSEQIVMRAANTMALRRDDRHQDGVLEWTTQRFTVTHPGGSVLIGVDGESTEVASPLEVTITPGALRILVPAGGAQSRPVHPVSFAAAKALWSLITHGGVERPGD